MGITYNTKTTFQTNIVVFCKYAQTLRRIAPYQCKTEIKMKFYIFFCNIVKLLFFYIRFFMSISNDPDHQYCTHEFY